MTNMARRYGRAPRGQRVIGSVPHGHWMTSTFIAGLRCDGIIAPCLFDGAINGELFLAYVEQQLAPSLTPDDIVVADNLGSHKVAGVREAIEARGSTHPDIGRRSGIVPHQRHQRIARRKVHDEEVDQHDGQHRRRCPG